MNRHDRAQLIAKLDGRLVVASVSGGKDSAAMSLYLTELDVPHRRVFCDTGWEHPATYAYLRGELTAAIGLIEELSSGTSLPELAMKKGIFPSRRKRYCTEKLKLEPLQKYISTVQDDVGDVVSAVGVRAAESKARAAMSEWEWSDALDCEVWRPMLRWTEQDVIDIHHRHGLRPNPLYLAGAARVGCWPCIHAGRRDLRLLARLTPDRIDEIRDLEASVTARAKEIVAARGEALRHPRTLLRERLPGFDSGIDGQVRWAMGSQGDLFPEPDTGCMRWGMCEPAAEADE